jgi:hypothetical protein
MDDYSGMPDMGSFLPAYGSGPQYGQQQPDRPSFLNAFQAGVKQRKPGQSPLLSGLSGYAGGGGVMGGIGSAAKFLL